MRALCLMLLIILSQHLCLAQKSASIPIEYFGVKQGLSQGYVSSILQDKEGFMWFGTSDGLNKFDGYKVSVYRNTPGDALSLPDNVISGLGQDAQGNIWISTRNKSLCVFDKRREQFHSVLLKEIPNHVGIHTMMLENNQLFIITNLNALLYEIDSFRIETHSGNPGQHVRLLFDYNAQQKNSALHTAFTNGNQISCLPENQIWLLNADTIIQYQWRGKNMGWISKGFSLKDWGLSKDTWYFHSLKPHPTLKNQLYVFDNNRIRKIDPGKNQVLETIQFDDSINLSPVHLEPALLPNGDFIIRKHEKLFHYNPGSGKISILPEELIKNGMMCNVSCLSKDGITWFGTSGVGAIKSDYRKTCFHVYPMTNNVNLFTMTDTKRVDVIPPHILASLFSLDMSNITQDQDGIYWAHSSMNHGLGSYNPFTGKVKIFSKSNIHPYRRRIFSDLKNRLWLFADQGVNEQYLFQLNKQTGALEQAYKIPIGTTNNQLQFVRDLYSDSREFVYLATEKGLFRLNLQAADSNSRWKIFQNNAKDTTTLCSNSLWCICPDPLAPNKYLWLGSTSNGLDRMEISSGNCIHFTEEDGLPNNVVYGILSDRSNNLWMSTNKGLSCLNPSTREFRNFTSEDGLSCEEFNHFEYRKLKSGELFFGGIGGYTIFNPEEVLQKQGAVPIVFTGLSISNKTIDFKSNQQVLDAPISYARTITLLPDQNMFTVSFASLEFRSNQKKFYKYKLLGFQDDWTEASTKNEATFTNLSPGTYTLQVTGTNTDGVWNVNGTSILIRILPAWYQTWWFRLLLASGILFGIWGLYRFRIRQITRVQAFREKIARDLHDEIGSTLSSISLYGESAKMMLDTTHPLHHVLNKINQSTHAMMESMSDIVWAINNKNDKLDNLVNRMNVFALQSFDASKCTVHFSCDEATEALALPMTDRKNVYLLFKEIIHNAAKHADCKNVWIELRIVKNKFILQIQDDGKGFNLQEYLTQGGEKSLGGNGLVNMQKRARELRAELRMRSQPGQGTRFEFEMGLRKHPLI